MFILLLDRVIHCYSSYLMELFPVDNNSLIFFFLVFFVISLFPHVFYFWFSSVQSLSHVWLFGTLWTAACQASLSIINSWGLFKLMSVELVMPTNHLILCYPLPLLLSIFPSIKVFSNESALCSAGQSTRVSVSTSVLPTNNQDWSPLGWTGWISLQSKGLSRVSSNTTVQKHQFFSSQLSL